MATLVLIKISNSFRQDVAVAENWRSVVNRREKFSTDRLLILIVSIFILLRKKRPIKKSIESIDIIIYFFIYNICFTKVSILLVKIFAP